MAIIKSFAPFLNLSNYQVYVNDTDPNSEYFRITEFQETFTGGKNGFLIEGSDYLKESTEIKIEILDVEGNPIYFEPGDGIPEYYEGNSKLVSVHVYDDTPIGIGKITILGELRTWNDNGIRTPLPQEWVGVYNLKWERTFNINKNLNNETIVRFYKRPSIAIDELVKPIFSKTIQTVTDTGTVTGVPQIPVFDTPLSSWRAGTLFKLIRSSGSWDRDVDENTISISSLNYSPQIIEVLNDKEVLVELPYTSSNGTVASFVSQSYSVSYADFQNEIIGESSLTGSFAKINMTRLKTFVGDVARVKVFRKSRNAIGDFQFVQESKLESTELLRDIGTSANTELSYGRLDESNLSTYWVTSSNDHPVSIDSSKLSQAAYINYNTVSGGTQKLYTSQSFELSKDVEYTLSFRTLFDGTISNTNNIKSYFSGSYTNNLGNSATFTQSFFDVVPDSTYGVRKEISQNILAEQDVTASLVFEFKGEDWYVSNISLKNAQDTSFSPDEFVLIQDIPRKLPSETFDFRFEFYDINNNYIPVDVISSKTFTGGNDFPTSGKLFTFESDRNAFRFSSGSIGNPPFQQLQFKTTQNNLTGSVTFGSSAFDENGDYIDPSSYTGTYPGVLTSVTPTSAILTIANFSGSDSSVQVSSIVYTASLEDLEEFETVYRLEDGDNAPALVVTSNANQFIYEPTTLTPKPIGQNITVRAQRKNLASLVTPITVKSGSNAPLTYVSTDNGIDTYTISATEFSSSFNSSNFDEVTYSFTGSDVFGNNYSDEITLSKVINFDGVSIVLSNESTSFPADSTGEVRGGFASSSGSVQMFIGSNQISHDDYDSDNAREKNTFDIKSITGTNVTPTDTSPNTANYSISAFPSQSTEGSLTLNIEYLAGDNATSQSFQKVVSYTKSKKAPPSVLVFANPQSQTISSGSDIYQTPSDISVTVREGSTTYTAGTHTTSTEFDISNVSSGFSASGNTISTTLTNVSESISGTADIRYTDTEGTEDSQSIAFSIGVSKQGNDGAPGPSGSNGESGSAGERTAQGIVHYQLSGSTQPSAPTATSFSFSNGTFSGLSTNWSINAPTYAAGNSSKYWYSVYTATETSPGSGVGSVTFGTVTQAIGFSGLVTFTTNDSVDDGLGNELSFGIAGTTAIHGDNIATGRIISTNYSNTFDSNGYLTAGMEFDLDNNEIIGTHIQITDGGAKFKGSLEAAEGTFEGSVNLSNGDYISSNGTLQLAGGDLTYDGTTFSFSSDLDLNSAGASDGGFSTQGIYLSTDGWISSENFYIDSSGNTKFTGDIEGGTIAIGTATSGYPNIIGSGDGKPFQINSSGEVVMAGNLSIVVPAQAGSSLVGMRIYDSSASGSPIRYAIQGPGIRFNPNTSSFTGGKLQWGGYAETYFGSATSTNVADWWEVHDFSGGGNGIQIDSGDLLVKGEIFATQNITGFYSSSDKRLKLNIKKIENPLIKISKLGGYIFDWDEEKTKYQKGSDIGVIAQEVQDVLPQIVRKNEGDGYLGVKYDSIIPLLIEGIKELTSKVETLEIEIQKLKGEK